MGLEREIHASDLFDARFMQFSETAYKGYARLHQRLASGVRPVGGCRGLNVARVEAAARARDAVAGAAWIASA